MRNFDQEIAACKDNMIYIDLDPATLQKIDAFVKEVIAIKQNEPHHRVDSGQEYKRFHTGLMGECALEKLFGVEFIDWSVGNSNTYNVADLKALGLNVGIKTVEFGKFPVVHKAAYRPEIICVKTSEKQVICCGLATTSALKLCQDDFLILSPALRARGTKTGFYGFNKLIKIESLDDVKKYAK